MGINQYYRYTPTPYISQYIPIPFQELYTMAKTYNDRIDQTYKDLSTAVQKWSEFRSPSEVDTQRYYDLTNRGAQELAAKFAQNPDLIKSAEAQREVQSYINSRDYAALANLKQSAQNMQARQQYNQQLALHGLYNEDFHGIDFSNYDTARQKIFNDVSPVPYKSVREIVEPYVNNLKDHYIGSRGGYLISGVTTDDTDKQVNMAMSDILSVPQVQKQLQIWVDKYKMTPDQALARMKNQIVTAGREYAHENREIDKYALARYKASLTNPQTPSTGVTRYSTQIQNEALEKERENFHNGVVAAAYARDFEAGQNMKNKLAEDNAKLQSQISKLSSQYNSASSKSKKQEILNQQRELQKQIKTNNVKFNDINRTLAQAYYNPARQAVLDGVKIKRNSSNTISYDYGDVENLKTAMQRFDEYFGNTQMSAEHQIGISHVLPGVSSKYSDFKGLGSHPVVNLSNNYMLDQTYYNERMHGNNAPINHAGKTFTKAMNSGQFMQVPVLSVDKVYVDPTIQNPQYAQAKITVAIPVDQMPSKALLSPNGLKNINATIYSGDKQYSSYESIRQYFVQRGDELKAQNQAETTSNSERGGKDYVAVHVVTNIPLYGSGSEAMNQAVLKELQKSAAAIAKEHSGTQEVSNSNLK